MKKIWTIFIRDGKVNTREAITLFIIMLPMVFAVGINLITPGINDTTVQIAMLEGEDPAREEFYDQFAHVELLEDLQALEDRVEKRDSVFGIIIEGNHAIVLAQGDEPGSLVDFAKLINVLYESDVQLKDARSEIVEFGKTTPPIKKLMVNVLLLFIAVFAGMLIALNILEEKTDRTVSAINIAPVSRTAFIAGKSMTGMIFAFLSSIACLLITGFYDINTLQALLVIFSTTLLSLIIGFVQGISSHDVMEAAGSVKLMFLPLAASIAGYELLQEKWQIFLYWSPFYWAYKANDMILSKSGTWISLAQYTGIILFICIVLYALLSPRIRKGLQ